MTSLFLNLCARKAQRMFFSKIFEISQGELFNDKLFGARYVNDETVMHNKIVIFGRLD